MTKYVRSFSRIAMLDSDGVVIAYVRIEFDKTIKIVRDIFLATAWDDKYRALQQCDQMNERSHDILKYKVVDYEVVQIERKVKPRRQPDEIALED